MPGSWEDLDPKAEEELSLPNPPMCCSGLQVGPLEEPGDPGERKLPSRLRVVSKGR